MKLGIGWFAGFMQLGIRFKDFRDLIGRRLHFIKNMRNPKLGGRCAPSRGGGESEISVRISMVYKT
jgi:hypothetical protein